MSEKMLVTQALDERDLLVKKINDKIAKASFVDTIKPNEDKVYAKRIDKAEYAKEAEAAYQQINDLIRRFQLIDAAIVESNAKTEVNTSYGTFSFRIGSIGDYPILRNIMEFLRRVRTERLPIAG